MKTKLLLTSAMAVALAAPAFAGSFTLEGLALTRDDYNSDRLFRDAPRPDAFASDLDVEWAGGARATYENDFWGHSWQLSAFFVAPQKTNTQFGAPGALLDFDAEYTFGDDLASDANSEDAEIMSATSQWETWGAEFNWVKKLTNSINGIVGVRYINFREKLATTVFDELNDFNGTDTDIHRVSLSTQNNLAGLQIGLEGEWNLTQDMIFAASLKGGVAANFVSRDRSFRSDDNALDNRNDQIDDTGFAQFVEFNPKLAYKLNDSATLVVGGNVTWLNEVSTASSHYATAGLSTDRNIRDDDDVLLYGATVGLKLALN
jgi:hypothetical protein